MTPETHADTTPIDLDALEDTPVDFDDRSAPRQASFDGLATMKGGEFFFAPSIPFLRYLA
jgi:hypothetical protein